MKKIVFALIFVTLLTTGALAVDVEDELSDTLGTGNLEASAPEQVQEILGESGLGVGDDLDSALSKIGGYIKEKLTSILTSGVRSAALMLTIVILCSIAESVYDGAVASYVPLGGVIAISAVAVGDLSSFIGLASQTLQTISDFSTLFLPCLAAAATASGAITSAATKYAATVLFMDVLLTASTAIILPMIYAYIATVIANAAVGGLALDGVTRLLKWLCTTLLTILTIAFTAYIGLTGIVTSSADVVTTRVAKTAISAALPVVGSMISDAAASLVSGVALVRNSIGVFGLLAVLCVCLLPFLRLGVQYLMYKAAGGLSATLADSRLSGLISSLGAAYGMIMALVGSAAMIMFFSIYSSIKVVGG